MSSIVSPRESLQQLRRIASGQLTTPTSSNRPSLETTRSVTGSPNPQSNAGPLSTTTTTTTTSSNANANAHVGGKRTNRVALREYYSLRARPVAQGAGEAGIATPPLLEVTDVLSVDSGTGGGGGGGAALVSEVPTGEIDVPGFDAEAYVGRLMGTTSGDDGSGGGSDEGSTPTPRGAGLEQVLAVYARVLGEIRALDAEKKALVYDNYSKLISATETIRKMRANMDPLAPMASTLDPAMGRIYEQATAIRESLRAEVAPPPTDEERAVEQRRTRTRELARIAAGAPARMRAMVADGRVADARAEWEMPRRLLERWRELGLGGEDVGTCLAEGDAVMRGVEGGEKGKADVRVEGRRGDGGGRVQGEKITL